MLALHSPQFGRRCTGKADFHDPALHALPVDQLPADLKEQTRQQKGEQNHETRDQGLHDGSPVCCEIVGTELGGSVPEATGRDRRRDRGRGKVGWIAKECVARMKKIDTKNLVGNRRELQQMDGLNRFLEMLLIGHCFA